MIVVLMGPTGVGKTTVGRLLAQRLGWEFADADDFHPEANIAKMSRGAPLEDADRWPWLAALRAAMAEWSAGGRHVVLACSALKQVYRDRLLQGPEVRYVLLDAPPDLVRERLRHRTGHFAGAALVASQYAILEVPADAVRVSVDARPEEIVSAIVRALGLPG